MNTPEQFVIGELYEAALTHEGYTVALDRNIGTASVRAAALGKGTLDIYPEYIGVWDSQPIKFNDSVKSAPRRSASSGSEKKSSSFFGKIFGK